MSFVKMEDYMWEDLQRDGLGRESQELCLGHVKSELPEKHSDGGIKSPVVRGSVKPRRAAW